MKNRESKTIKKTATTLVVTVEKFPTQILTENEPQGDCKPYKNCQRSSNLVALGNFVANKGRKKIISNLKKLINCWSIKDAHTFAWVVSNTIGASASIDRVRHAKDVDEISYYVLLEDFSLRIGLHNLNAENYKKHNRNRSQNYSVTIKDYRNSDTFREAKGVNVMEFVYLYESEERLKKVAQAILHLLETGEWDESIAPADAKNISPMRKNEKGLEGYDSINSVFNERLKQQIDGELEKGFIYELGLPSEALISAGMENYPIEMAASRLVDKSMQENHPFELSEVFDLPMAIQKPLAVFRSATKIGAFVVLTELKHEGRSFVAAIQINQRKHDLDVNSIRSVHYRTLKNIIGWIEDGLGEYFCPDFCKLWLEPTKKELLSKPQYNSVDVRKQLSTVAKVVKDFLDTNNSEKKNISPMKKNEKVGKLQGIKTGASRGKTKKTKYLCGTCQWYVGCTWCKDGMKSVCDGYKPYNTDYEYPSFDGICGAKKTATALICKIPLKVKDVYKSGEKMNISLARNMAIGLDLSENELMQLCELGLVIEAKRIAVLNEPLNFRFEKMVDLYGRQLTIQPKDSRSATLQQYSTPCPLAFLLGEYVKKGTEEREDDNIKFFEPTAGNGLLTISFRAYQMVVNELDDIRFNNLKRLGFFRTTNEDATCSSEPLKCFSGIIANPPFAPLEKKDFLVRKGVVDGREAIYEFDRLDHKIAIMALDHMKDDGRAAIIIGGKMAVKLKDYKESYWKNGVLFGGFRNFITYLNRQYNIEDILYINGDLYRKQGTTFPIVAILINGRTKWNGDKRHQWHPFDESKDGQIDTFNELYHRMSIHLFGEVSVPSALKAKALMLKMKMAKSKGLDGTATDSVAITFNKMLLLYSKGRLKKHEIFVCKAPDFWIDKGLECCDVMLPVSVIEKAMVKYELLLEHFVNFPDSLRKGNELFLSKSVKGAYVQLTELRDYKNNRVVVAIHLRRKDTGYVVYKIASVHGRVERQFDKWRGQNLNL